VTGADHELLLAGQWRATDEWAEVANPYDGSTVGRVAQADEALVDEAIEAAHTAFRERDFPQYARAEVLDRAARLVKERAEDLAQTIAAEAGKPLKTARIEADRCADTLTFSAVEARKLTGGTVPMEASAGGVGKVGLVLRVPYGVVAAISPFNFPLNLVAHKVGPAIAAGNTVVLKPAPQAPITALKLAQVLLDAGLPDGWLSVLPGDGPTVGNALVSHPLTKAISFTGSAKVGWGIRSRAPHKKVNLELGSNAPLVVDEDGDWELAADKAHIHAFAHAGQVCISIQRVLVHEAVADRFTEKLVSRVEELVVGDPRDPETDVGPLITPVARERVKGWIDEALVAGAELLAGGELVDDGRCLAPTLLKAPPRDTKVWREEVFGPLATVHTFSSFREGLEMANDSELGLQAGVFTRDVGKALEAADTLEFGGVMVNDVPSFRAEQMPYGGVKGSGNTHEGPAFAVQELTQERLVTLQALPQVFRRGNRRSASRGSDDASVLAVVFNGSRPARQGLQDAARVASRRRVPIEIRLVPPKSLRWMSAISQGFTDFLPDDIPDARELIREEAENLCADVARSHPFTWYIH
jgi:acyl-CoA reductase-like NAD-dependent aldehyde dehydrogenase